MAVPWALPRPSILLKKIVEFEASQEKGTQEKSGK